MTPTEPTADLRAFAGHMWQMFQALVQAGFSEAQALQIMGTLLAAHIKGGGES